MVRFANSVNALNHETFSFQNPPQLPIWLPQWTAWTIHSTASRCCRRAYCSAKFHIVGRTPSPPPSIWASSSTQAILRNAKLAENLCGSDLEHERFIAKHKLAQLVAWKRQHFSRTHAFDRDSFGSKRRFNQPRKHRRRGSLKPDVARTLVGIDRDDLRAGGLRLSRKHRGWQDCARSAYLDQKIAITDCFERIGPRRLGHCIVEQNNSRQVQPAKSQPRHRSNR